MVVYELAVAGTENERGGENGDILRFHQFLWTYDQSEARIESHRETIEGKGGSLDWAGCSKRLSSKAAGESKPEAYPLGYVEDFDELRTKPAGF